MELLFYVLKIPILSKPDTFTIPKTSRLSDFIHMALMADTTTHNNIVQLENDFHYTGI